MKLDRASHVLARHRLKETRTMDAFSAALKQFFESLDSMGAVRIFGSLGFAAIVIGLSRWFVDRRRWGHFKAAAHQWLEFLIESQNRHPKDLRESEWQAECERMLVDARFRPGEIVQLLDLAVIVSKAIAANKVLM